MASAAQYSGPAVTPDLEYAEIMFIRSLADRNRAPRAVKLVTVLRRVPSQLRPGKLRGKRLVDKPGRTRRYPVPPLAGRAVVRRGVFASKNGLALFLVLRVPGAAINQAQREAALIRSTFRKSIANKPL